MCILFYYREIRGDHSMDSTKSGSPTILLCVCTSLHDRGRRRDTVQNNKYIRTRCDASRCEIARPSRRQRNRLRRRYLLIGSSACFAPFAVTRDFDHRSSIIDHRSPPSCFPEFAGDTMATTRPLHSFADGCTGLLSTPAALLLEARLAI